MQELGGATGQRWYCHCAARYYPKFDQLQEIIDVKRGRAYSFKTKGADHAIMDIKRMLQEMRPGVNAATSPLSHIPYTEPCKLNVILRPAERRDYRGPSEAPPPLSFSAVWVAHFKVMSF